jgi:hypothetical protein
VLPHKQKKEKLENRVMLWRQAGGSSTYRRRDPHKRSPTKLASIRLCSDHGGHAAASFCDDRHNKPRCVFAIKRENSAAAATTAICFY